MTRNEALDKYPEVVHSLLTDVFGVRSRKPENYKYELKPGDGELPLAELVVRVFGSWKPFFFWLINPQDQFGSMLPIELLSCDRESWIVRTALLDLWLTKNKLVVEPPSGTPPKFKIVTKRGGFIQCVRV